MNRSRIITIGVVAVLLVAGGLFVAERVTHAMQIHRAEQEVSRVAKEAPDFAIYDHNHAVIAEFSLRAHHSAGGFALLVKIRSLTPEDPEHHPEWIDDPRAPYIAWLTVNAEAVPLVPTATGDALYTVLAGDWWKDLTSLSIDVEDEEGVSILQGEISQLAVR